MARKTENPLDKIVVIRSRLDMYVRYGDAALNGATPQEFCSEVLAAFVCLMDVRNIVLAAARLDESPTDAVRAMID